MRPMEKRQVNSIPDKCNDYIMTRISESNKGYECVCARKRERQTDEDKIQYLNLWLYVSERVAQHVCLVSCGLDKHHREYKEY